MKHIVFLLLITMAIHACHKEPDVADPRDASRIEGAIWTSLTGGHPAWQYEFHDGLVRQYVDDLGAVVSDNTYPYAIRKDTVFIGGDAENAPRRWILHFYCDSVLQARTQGAGIIQPTLYLHRIR